MPIDTNPAYPTTQLMVVKDLMKIEADLFNSYQNVCMQYGIIKDKGSMSLCGKGGYHKVAAPHILIYIHYSAV